MKTKEEMRAYKTEWARLKRASMSEQDKEALRAYHLARYHADPEKSRKSSRAWKARNADKMKADRASYYAANKEKELAQAAQWRINNRDLYKQIKSQSDRRYRQNNTDKLKIKRKMYASRRNANTRHQYKTDPQFRIRVSLRETLRRALRLSKNTKTQSVIDLIGCTMSELKNHLEKQFRPGMEWTNIHIDHIRPCASFNLMEPERQRECFHFTNLRPLFPEENLTKGAKWEGKSWRYGMAL